MKDRVVVVTGAARGIGAETARQLLAAGARVAPLDLDGAALEGTVRALDPSGSRTAALRVDVTDRAALDASVTALVERWGRVDAVVHGAAIIVPGAIDTLAPEVLVRGARGALVKLITYSPWLFARIYPVLDAMGERARRAYLRRLDEAPPTRPESR